MEGCAETFIPKIRRNLSPLSSLKMRSPIFSLESLSVFCFRKVCPRFELTGDEQRKGTHTHHTHTAAVLRGHTTTWGIKETEVWRKLR